jgi:molybdopterin converting factor small subunit
MQVRLMISGRHYDWSRPLPGELTLADGATLDDALKAVAAMLPEGRQLPESCLVAVSGQHVGTLRSHQARALREGDELLLFAPVAGG